MAAASADPHEFTMKVLYCTGNEGKFKEASFVFEEFNARGGTTVEIVQVDADPVEVQGSAEEIGTSKVTEAVRILRAKGAIPEGRVGGFPKVQNIGTLIEIERTLPKIQHDYSRWRESERFHARRVDRERGLATLHRGTVRFVRARLSLGFRHRLRGD